MDLLLLSVTIALGLLYVNLKEARYRDRLLRSVAFIARSRDIAPEHLPDTQAYNKLMAENDSFSDSHHLVSSWLRELPADAERPASMQVFTGGSQVKLPDYYTFLKQNRDRWLCAFVACFMPIALIWADFLYGDNWTAPSVLIGWLCALAQTTVLGCIAAGNRMVKRGSEAFRRALREVFATLEQQSSKGNWQEYATKQRSAIFTIPKADGLETQKPRPPYE